MKLAYYDLETWDLSPEFGPLLCVSALCVDITKWTKKMVSLRQDTYVRKGLAEDMTDDRQLAIDARDMLENHHLISAFYGKGFDSSFLNTRLIYHGERKVKSTLYFDPHWAHKGWRGIKPKSGSLKNVAAFYGFEEEKFDVSPETWLKARGGNKKAMDLVQKRCESDVRLLAFVGHMTLENRLVANIGVYP